MSKWVRGIYNAAANFNMSGSLRAAAGRFLDRDDKHVHEESNKSDQHVESSQSCQSNKSDKSASFDCTCDRKCSCSRANQDRSVIIGNDVIITDPIDRDYSEYVEYTASACREDVSTWVRVSNEYDHIKPSNTNTTDPVERCTGVPTGVTV